MKTRIKDLRDDNDLTQQEISKFLNISQVAYSYYELNKRNKEIAKKHKNGKTIEELADEYYLTGYSIRRIIKKVDL